MYNWDKWVQFFEAQGLTPQQVFGANAVATVQQNSKVQSQGRAMPQNVSLPPHLFTPNGAQSIDARRLATIATGTTDFEFFRFEAPPSGIVHFMAYSIFSDGTLAASQLFVPRVNGKRVFPFHGDPNDQFKINLGLGPDLSNQNLIQCQLTLQPKDVLTWSLTNTSGVDVAMGVRMVGYVDQRIQRVSSQTGVS